jgi:HNH endonuclease
MPDTKLVWSTSAERPGAAGRMDHQPNVATQPPLDKKRRALRRALEGQTCSYCPAPATTWDHFVPRSKGGRLTIENRRPACEPCNVRKADHDPEEWFRMLNGPVQRTQRVFAMVKRERPVCPLCGWIVHGQTVPHRPGRRAVGRIRRSVTFEWQGDVKLQQVSIGGHYCQECGFEMVAHHDLITRQGSTAQFLAS